MSRAGAEPLHAPSGRRSAIRRGRADGGHRRAGRRVRPIRLSPDHRPAVAGRMAGQRQARGADLAPRGAEGPFPPAQEARALMAQRRLLCPAAGGAQEPCLVLRLRYGPHARGQGVPDADDRGRVHAGVAGDPGGAQAQCQ